LAAEEIDKHNDAGPDLLGFEGDDSHWVLDFRDDVDGWLDEMKQFGSFFGFYHL